MDENVDPELLLSRSGQKWPKLPSLPAISDSVSLPGKLPAGMGHHSCLCPRLKIWTKAWVGLLGNRV